MNNIVRTIFFSFLSIFFIAYPAQRPQVQKNLAIALDLPLNEWEEPRAIALELLYLLEARRATILTNTPVWENVKTLFSRMGEEKTLEVYISSWHVYKKGDYLLLIPAENAPEAGLNLGRFKKKQLDCRSNAASFVTWMINGIAQAFYSYFPFGLHLKSRSFVRLLKGLVLPKSDFDSVSWNIFLVGHGSTIYQTAGMTETSFARLLDVLEHDIKTHVFYYTSCFAGGKISDHIYKDKVFSYPIFVEGSDASTYVTSHISADFFEPLEKLCYDDMQTYKNIAKNCAERSEYNINNLLSVRLPYSKYFETLPVEGHIFPVKQDTTPEDCAANDSIKPTYCVIESPCIPIHLKIANGQHIVSGIRGDAHHYMKSIEITGNDVPQQKVLNFILNLSEKFKKAAQFDSKKMFVVDQIVLNDVYKSDSVNNDMCSVTLNNIIIFVNSDISYWYYLTSWFSALTVVFQSNDKYFLFNFWNDASYKLIELDSKNAKPYLDLFEKSKTTLLNGEEMRFWDKGKNDFTVHSIARSVYPWLVTAFGALSIYLRIRSAMNKYMSQRLSH